MFGFKKNIRNNVYKALCLLIESSLHTQKESHLNVSLGDKPPIYIREMQTVKISSSRTAGHTTAIAKYLKKHQNKGDYVVVFKTSMQLELFKRKLDPKNMKNVHLVILNKLEKTRGLRPVGVFVDMGSNYSEEEVEKLYDVFAGNEDFFIAFVE